jgi:excisionase family DNA binding protein
VNAPLLTPEEVFSRLRIGKTLGYKLLASGGVRSLRVGAGKRAIRVTEEALDDYIRHCEGGDESARTGWNPTLASGGHGHARRRAS